jgi:hypothetical protein
MLVNWSVHYKSNKWKRLYCLCRPKECSRTIVVRPNRSNSSVCDVNWLEGKPS